jgi:hypothetical protein
MTNSFGQSPKGPADRGFGDIELRKYAALQGYSTAMHEAATNLVDKASFAVHLGQIHKALGYLRIAERLPYDDYGGARPLALAAHMYAYESVLRAFELGEGAWVDAGEVLTDPDESWDPLAMADFRHVLSVIGHDYGTTPREERQLRTLLDNEPVATIREKPELAGEELCRVVIDLLAILIAYEYEVEEAAEGLGLGEDDY